MVVLSTFSSYVNPVNPSLSTTSLAIGWLVENHYRDRLRQVKLFIRRTTVLHGTAVNVPQSARGIHRTTRSSRADRARLPDDIARRRSAGFCAAFLRRSGR